MLCTFSLGCLVVLFVFFSFVFRYYLSLSPHHPVVGLGGTTEEALTEEASQRRGRFALSLRPSS